ncbi:MAG: DnaA regulatory inactivator Hda [Steroidobacterales bacterium]
MKQLPLGVRVRERSVFESFFAGPNAAAVALCQALAAGTQPGVLWLWGPAGCGKTHLLQAACAQAGSAREAVYLPLAQLAQLGAGALEGWPMAACLCLDDIESVLGGLEWEAALFRLYREIEERGASLLVAASAPPALLAFALPDLGSRYAAAAVFQLRALDELQQREALRLRAQLRGLELPEETALYLQRRFRRDMKTLYDLLDALDEAALAAQRRLTVPFIREALAQTRV